MAKEGFQNILIPNVSKVPEKSKVSKSNEASKNPQAANEFKNLLKEEVGKSNQDQGIALSLHAAKRLKERNMNVDSNEFLKLKEAMTKLKGKGGRDSLVITEKGAYIVDVGNNKIVTAMDKESMSENVFTKIDSTLIMN